MTESSSAGFPVSTGFALPGMTVEKDLGVAFGLVVRSMGVVKSLGAGFKAMRQGEVTQYTELLEDSRRHAMDRMIENARLMGANAVVNIVSVYQNLEFSSETQYECGAGNVAGGVALRGEVVTLR